MAAIKGRDLLLRIEDADNPGSYLTLAGLRARAITLSSSLVDTTSADSPGAWRELIADGGIKSARITGRGVVRDQDSEQRLRQVFFSQSTENWQICIENTGKLIGPFIITGLTLEGSYDNEVTFSITLASAGEIHSYIVS